jgi:molecular chaperone DnaK (HSP70)
VRHGLEVGGCEFNRKLFDYLVSKFKKLRKTKEEMVKYCVRKSFKYITTKMRAAHKEQYTNM